MHTDEYEISLLREVHVCERAVGEIKKRLAMLERKYKMTTDVFIGEYKISEEPPENDDFSAWVIHYESLKKFEALRGQYSELLRKMKI